METKKKALVLGLGIGSVYAQELTETEYEVSTVDNNKPEATYKTMDDVPEEMTFRIVVCCLPNFLHEEAIHKFAKRTDIIIVEKPGLKSVDDWNRILKQYSRTYIFLAKNNMFRIITPAISKMIIDSISKSLVRSIEISWINKNRIPHPGSWFTNKDLAWGGVHRDLMPHIFSIARLFGFDYRASKNPLLYQAQKTQQYTLDEITSTEYGSIDKNGTYNVDDACEVLCIYNDIKWHFTATWALKDSYKNMREGFYMSVFLHTGEVINIKLGLCPDHAYGLMCNFYDRIVAEDMYEEIASHYDADRDIISFLETFQDGVLAEKDDK